MIYVICTIIFSLAMLRCAVLVHNGMVVIAREMKRATEARV